MSDFFSDMCWLYGRERESVDHIFLQCWLALYIWGYFFKKCTVAWCAPKSLSKLMEAWRGSPLVGCGRILWKIVHFSIIWSIWNRGMRDFFRKKESS